MKVVRKNGFQRPFGVIQVFSWVFFVLILINFIVFTLPFLRIEETVSITQAVALITLLLCLPIVTFYWGLATWKNAGDDVGQTVGNFCRLCFKYVKDKSRHCKICNKCVVGFDHHCSLLNNCIGENNYIYFIKLLTSSLCISLSVFIFSFLLTVRIAYQLEKISNSKVLPINVVLGLNILTLILTFSVVLGICSLLLLHLYLKYLGMTTYEYIISKRPSQPDPSENEHNKVSTSREIEITRITPEVT